MILTTAHAQTPSLKPQRRQPVALALGEDGHRLLVANSQSGTISVIDPDTGQVVQELETGGRLVDLASVDSRQLFLAVDAQTKNLRLIRWNNGRIQTIDQAAPSASPTRVFCLNDGSFVVSSRWGRSVTFGHVENTEHPSTAQIHLSKPVELPFSPGSVVFAASAKKLIVADAFGGQLAVIDPQSERLETVRSLPAHNIRGMAITADGRTLVLAHQLLRRQAGTTFENVHWGSLLTSHLRSLRVDAVLGSQSDSEVLDGGCLIDLGSTMRGAGDPTALALDRTGAVVVALAGVDEIAVSQSSTGHVRRHPGGAGPSALLMAADARTVFVANRFSDSISVVDFRTGRTLREISLGPCPEPTLVDQGERLFYDARLSHDGWMSCQSCHTDGHSNGQMGDTLGDESYGAPKRVPSLLGTGTTGPWSWTGSMARLEDQVGKSIELTMRGRPPTSQQVDALTAYLRSLAPPSTPAQAQKPDAVARGRALFQSERCVDCHAAPNYTSKGRYDVGLADEVGNREFNPPSLRGVTSRAPLLHDGRAANLEDVFRKHRHPTDVGLTNDEIQDLVSFLKTL